MIQLKDITKVYTTGTFTQKALDGVSLNFKEQEFVVILGQSGSGKTTFLNVLGGLDQYTSGDLIINGRSTKKFRASDWDAYRNNSVGFIFQSYNLIPHLSVIDNVEMGMTLSGISGAQKRSKSMELLEKVGLSDHIHKKPNQLSGGQMQRVAIARALANDPDIILADEPTGALDTTTSEQIMQLIREISKDKLVVMVTHNPELADRYADRVVEFEDGHILTDSNPVVIDSESDNYRPNKTSMSFFTALKLSGKNIMTKKGRTALTAFASSIGIIGVALVLSLSNGFDIQIDNFEKNSLSNYPITISRNAISMISAMGRNTQSEAEEFPDDEAVHVYDSSQNLVVHTNEITSEYLDYINGIDENLYDGISYSRSVEMNILKEVDQTVSTINTSTANFFSYPAKDNQDSGYYFSQYYDVLAGELPHSKTDLVLIVDEYNQLDKTILNELGFDSSNETISFDEIVGTSYKLVDNDDYYQKSGNYYVVNGSAGDLSDLYDSDNATTLTITAVMRIKSDSAISILDSGIAYSDALALDYIAAAQNSQIVLDQQELDYNVLDGSRFATQSTSGYPGQYSGMPSAGFSLNASITKDEMMASLGASYIPESISIYPVNFDAKEELIDYLDQWNEGLDDDARIEYTDLAATITNLSGTIMDGVTIVLVAFAAVSLIVSMIMIAIIIYISVLERTKEIGILRALGARGKDITRVFNAETFIIGACSGLLGISLAYLLTIPANAVLYEMTELENVAQLDIVHATGLVIISIVLTFIGGFIPAKMAAKKDPVEALRSE